jgi:hypothetical protein
LLGLSCKPRRTFIFIGLTIQALHSYAAVGSTENQSLANNRLSEVQICRSSDTKICELGWHSCTKLAETNRSERNLIFMLRAKTLINKNTGFLGHTESTHELFCADIGACEAAFVRRYSSDEYPSCNGD